MSALVESDMSDLLDVFERDLLRLPGRHGQDVHLEGGQAQRRVVLQLGAEALQHHVVAALPEQTGQGGQEAQKVRQKCDSSSSVGDESPPPTTPSLGLK